MDLRQLRYFVAIVEAGGFSRAAERLHVAQSALSLHVRRMEEDLQVQLLVREATGVRPTEAGLKLLEHARAILGHVRAAEADLRSENGRPSGAVTLGVPAGVGRVLNTPLLEAARRELPEVTLQLVEVLPTHVRDWLASEVIKLGISYQLCDADEPGRLLAAEHFYLVSGTPEPRWEGGVTLRDLADIPLIMPTCSHNPRHCIVTYASERGIELTVESRVDSLATILDLTVNGPGRSVLSPAAFLPEWRAGKLFAYPLVPAVKRSVLLSVADRCRGDHAVHAVETLVARTSAALLAKGIWPQTLAQVARSAA